MTRILSEAEALNLIAGGKIGRLGFVDNGEPYDMPINYVFEEGSIYSLSLLGRKIEALRTHPGACLQVDEIEDDFNWRSVIAHGDFDEIRVPSERRSIASKLLARFPLSTPVESVMAQDAGAPKIVVFRMRIDRMTGVAEGLTAAACFPERKAIMRQNLDLSVWTNYFNEFTRRNQSRPTRLEVFGDLGAQQEECGMPFAGIALDTHRGGLPSIEIMFGGRDAMGPRHLTHVIANVLEITPKLGLDGRDAAIEIISAQGETSLLCFETQGMLRA